MRLPFYTKQGDHLAGYVGSPEEFASLVNDIGDGFYLREADLAAWRRQEALAAVRAEAARRMRALVNARDDRHLDIIISNGLREAARLLRKEVDGEALTAEEQARKAELRQIDAALEAIRAASNALEAMDPIPADYTDDKWWP